MSVAIPLLCIVALAVVGTPIWLAMIGGVIPYFGFLESMLPTQIIIQRFVVTVESASFLAIPLFVTAGVVMNYAGISSRLLDLADALVGHLAGGLGHCNVLLSVLMGGVSGYADQAVADYLAGKLNYNPNVMCNHHDEHHGEGTNCGHGSCGSHKCH